MIIDAQLEIATAQAVTANAMSENVIDFGAAGDTFPDQLWLNVRVGTVSNPTTSMTFEIYTHTAAPTTGTPGTLLASKTVLTAALTADTNVWSVKLPVGVKRYLGLEFTPNGGDATTGTYDVYLTPSAQNNDFSA